MYNKIFFAICLKFKFNWTSYILSVNPSYNGNKHGLILKLM